MTSEDMAGPVGEAVPEPAAAVPAAESPLSGALRRLSSLWQSRGELVETRASKAAAVPFYRLALALAATASLLDGDLTPGLVAISQIMLAASQAAEGMWPG